MGKDERAKLIKTRVEAAKEPPREVIEADVEEEISLVSADLPKVNSVRRILHRRIGFWPDTIEKCRGLVLNQAIKVRLLREENPTNFASTARAVAKQKGFYLNCVYKYPFMYLWPDRMRGKVLPEDWNSKGAIFFENEEEINT
jgi:hypothetical protein